MPRLLPLVALLALLVLAPAAPGDARPAADVRVGRIVLADPGTYRLEPGQLRELGIEDPLRVDVRRAGKPVPQWRDVSVAKVSGCVVFAARAPRADHGRYAVYEVWQLARPASPTPADAPEGFRKRREDARNRVLGALAAADPTIYDLEVPVWFLGLAPPGQSMPVDLGAADSEPGSTQMLVAEVFTTWFGPVEMHATWNGADLGRARTVSGVGGAKLTWRVPPEALPKDKPARLMLRNVSPPPPPPPARDVSERRGTIFVDRVRLEGPAPDAVWRWTQARPATVEKTGPARDPLAKAGSAQHVILAVPALLESSRKLAAHRTKHGVPSVVVPVLDVYDRYGHGEHTPRAIMRFVDALLARKDAPLRYVVLAGDATYDRTDQAPVVTIPAPVTRTKWNGATAADRLYVRRKSVTENEPAIGRLPFRGAAEMEAYVERLVQYETKPPAHASRRMLRFITSEARFSPVIDALIERTFRGILAREVPAAYDIEVTYANARSPFLWPPAELSTKVVEGLNDGALFFTYVGHGFEKGFDTLQVGDKRYGIFHVRDVERVDIGNTPPVVFVLACTTAMFDGLRGDGVGEALMKRPNGPVAFWGASRICHPIYNAFVGQAIASNLGREGAPRRLGPLLALARAQAPGLAGRYGPLIRMLPAVDDLPRHFDEGGMMYVLLGDPALKLALPQDDVALDVSFEVPLAEMVVDVAVAAPDGTEVHVSLEAPRNVDRTKPVPVPDPSDPASWPTIRKNHALMNDRAYERTTVKLKDGKAQARFAWRDPPFEVVVKAWCIAKGDVHHGAVHMDVPAPEDR